jgi:hypothetical protein
MNQAKKLRGRYHSRLKMRVLRLAVRTLRLFRVKRKLRRDTQSAWRTLRRVSRRVVCWNPVKVAIISAAITVGLVSTVLHLPHHYREVGWGILLFIVGSAASLGTESWKKRKRLKWLRPIFIPILLAAGALFTTQGWNTVTDYKREQALVTEVASEWKMNELRNRGIEFLRDYIQTNDNKKDLFEVPTHWQITRAIDIGKLDRSSIEYSPLRLALVNYVSKIDYLCLRLAVINELFTTPLLSKESYHKIVQQTFGNGDAYPEYLKTHRLVETILRKDYPGLLEQTDWMNSEWKTREKESGGKWPVEPDPNTQIDPNARN